MPDTDLAKAMAHAWLTHYPEVDEASQLLAEWIENDGTLDYPEVVEYLRSPDRDLEVDIQTEFGVDYLDCDRFWQVIWMKTTRSQPKLNASDYENRLLRTMVLDITRHGIL